MKALIYNQEGVLVKTIPFENFVSKDGAIRITQHMVDDMEDKATPYWAKVVLNTEKEPTLVYGKTYQMKSFFQHHPYCITDWDYIVADMDNNNIIDKINLLSKEWKELNINTSLSYLSNEWDVWGQWLNEIFGLKGYKWYEYGVHSIWISGFDYSYKGKGYGARMPRIHIKYYTNGVYSEHRVYIGEKAPESKSVKCRNATDAEILKVYEWMLRVIQYRKDQIKKQTEAPSFEEMQQLCIDEANRLLKDSKYYAKPKVCSSQSNPNPQWRLVYYYKGCQEGTIFSQAGAMTLKRDNLGFYHGEYMACSVHSSDWRFEDWHEYKELVKKSIDFLG